MIQAIYICLYIFIKSEREAVDYSAGNVDMSTGEVALILFVGIWEDF